MSFLDDFKKTNLQRQSDADAIQTNIRAGIGTTYIDFAIVDNATSLVATTIVGYADTSKNPTCAEMGLLNIISLLLVLLIVVNLLVFKIGV